MKNQRSNERFTPMEYTCYVNKQYEEEGYEKTIDEAFSLLNSSCGLISQFLNDAIDFTEQREYMDAQEYYWYTIMNYMMNNGLPNVYHNINTRQFISVSASTLKVRLNSGIGFQVSLDYRIEDKKAEINGIKLTITLYRKNFSVERMLNMNSAWSLKENNAE